MQTTRRSFLKSGAIGTLAFPTIIRAQAIGKNAPSNRITMGIIGCGNQATVDLKQWLPMEDVQIIAVCDANRASFGYRTDKQYLGREPIANQIEEEYARRSPTGSFKGCSRYNDFRDLLARSDIDTVAIITPDHWHAIQTIQAAQAGKDIYCQKPLGLTVKDGQEMLKAVKKHNRVLQTGSQWRSNNVVQRFSEAVRNGVIGKPRKAIAYVAKNNFEGPGPGWQPTPVPEGLDYDMWLGPAPLEPYHKDRCFYKFRFVSNYSGGQTTNFGHHSIGVAMLALGIDHLPPTGVWNLGAEWPLKGDLFDTATKVHFGLSYPDGLELECVTSPKNFGVMIEGEKGWIEFTRNKINGSTPEIANWEPQADSIQVYRSENHYRNFIDCVRSRKDTCESIEIGHAVSNACHLGNIAMKLDRKLTWDGKLENFGNDAEANGMLAQKLRAPWSYA